MISVHNEDGQMYLSAQEAADALGVSRTTLYAYVSRRGIRSVAVPGSRERLYWRTDIERAKTARGRPPVRRENAPPPESAISLIGPDALYYRGMDAVALAKHHSLEQVAALLWDQPEAAVFTDRLPIFPETMRQIAATMRTSSGTARAAAALPLIEDANPRSFDFSPAGMASTGADVLRSLTALKLGAPAPSAAPIHEQVGAHLGLSFAWQDFVRRMLVLSADHGFEPSTYAVRSVAGIGVSPYRSVAAGLLLVGGRRTQLGRFDVITRLLTDICEGDPDEVMLARLKGDDQVPGFGYDAYRHRDPRARALLDQLDVVMGDAISLKRLKRAIAIVEDARGLYPDYALVSEFAGRQFMEDKRDSMFVLGRSVGWIAHSIEQYRTGEAIRPASIYTGRLPDQIT